MAKLYITEYARQAVDSRGISIQAGEEPPIAVQAVDFTAGVTASAAFNDKTKFVRLHTDAICSISFGAAPVATANHPRMAANQTEYFPFIPATGMKVSAIVNT